MAILNIQTSQTGLVGVKPSLAYIETNDPIATIMTAGYLNHIVDAGTSFTLPCIAAVTTKETPTSASKVGWFDVSHSGGTWSLIASSSSSGEVILPTQLNHIAAFANSMGTIFQSFDTLIHEGNIQAGVNETSGEFISYPLAPDSGRLILRADFNTGNTDVIITNAEHGQESTYIIPDTGAPSAEFLMSEGDNNTRTLSVINLSTGAIPVPVVDPVKTEFNVVAGAANTALIEIQLKDGNGAELNRIIPFTIYASSAANGLTLASPASTGFSFAGTGLSLANGTAVTTQIHGVTSAGGQAVLSLLDTAKQNSYLVVVVGEGIAISDQLTNGSYG